MSILFSYDSTTSWDDGHFDQFFASTYANPFPSTKRVAGTPVWHDGTPYGIVGHHASHSDCIWDYHINGDASLEETGIYNLASGELLLQINDPDTSPMPTLVPENAPGLIYYNGCFYYFVRGGADSSSGDGYEVHFCKYDISTGIESYIDSYDYTYFAYSPAAVLDGGYIYFSYEEFKFDTRSGPLEHETWLTCKKVELATDTVTTIDSKSSIAPGTITMSDPYYCMFGATAACTDSDYYYTTVRSLWVDRWRYVKKDGTANGWAEGSWRTTHLPYGMSTYLGSDLGFAFRNDADGEYVFFFSGGSVSAKVATDAGIPARLGGGYVLNASSPYYVLLFQENSTNCYLVEVDTTNETNTLKETYTGIGGASCSTFRGGSQLIKAEDIDRLIGPLYTYGYNRSNGFFFPYGEIL